MAPRCKLCIPKASPLGVIPLIGEMPAKQTKGCPPAEQGRRVDARLEGCRLKPVAFISLFPCNNPSVSACGFDTSPYTGEAENCAHFYQLLSRKSTTGPQGAKNSLPPHPPLTRSPFPRWGKAWEAESRDRPRRLVGTSCISLATPQAAWHTHSAVPPLSQKVQLRSHFLRGWASPKLLNRKKYK